MTTGEISAILSTSRRRNTEDDLTGLLIYDNRVFLQVLEGTHESVSRCMARISADKRHSFPAVMWEAPIDDRTFSNFAMAYKEPEDLADSQRAAVVAITELKAGKTELLDSDSFILALIQSALGISR